MFDLKVCNMFIQNCSLTRTSFFIFLNIMNKVNWCMFGVISLLLHLQMMPEIRVALFGANPNRKFLDWEPPLYLRQTLLFIFYFVIWKTSFLYVWNEISDAEETHCCCVMYCCIYLFTKGQYWSCSSTLQMCMEGDAHL